MNGLNRWITQILTIIFATNGIHSDHHYRKIYLDGRRCPESGGKTEIKLGTQSAILIFNESSISTYNTLKTRNLYCHFELENASKDYGFHFYFEEINLDSAVENSSSLIYGKACDSDFVRFGRDKFGIHIFTSKHYCGRAPRINYPNGVTNVNTHQGNRLYIENQDDDVDVEVNIERNTNRASSFNRTLILVVTIFKKNCIYHNSRSNYWNRCNNTNVCVPKKYFCDQYSNCGWPDGLIASEEKYCQYKSTFLYLGWFRKDNIPIHIIVFILVLAFIVLITGVIKKVVGVFRILTAPHPPDDAEESTVAANDINREASAPSSSIDNALVVTYRNGSEPEINIQTNEGEPLEKPPSYDEVVKDLTCPAGAQGSQTLSNSPAIILDRSQPPPYTP